MTIERCFIEPETHYFLFGPRGSGKSTYLALKHSNDSLWLNLLDPATERNYKAYPERLNDLIAAHTDKRIIVIDEIQRVPELLPLVHDLIEKKLGLIFILTGSSSRKLKRIGTDLLGGRAIKRMMHPFIAYELGENFKLLSALKMGMIPLVYDAVDHQDTLNTYVGMYLQEEIKAEGLVRNLGDFSRFLEVISLSHGSIVNVSNIARDCQVKRKTVENYIQVLEDLMLARQLPVFTRRAQRDLISHPKIYLFDVGIYQTLRPRGPFDTQSEVNGMALEGLVWQHLVAWIDYTKTQHKIYYWRTRGGVEIDFVIYGETGLWAIEVKMTENINNKDLKGLIAFKKDYPEAMTILLYCGKEKLKINGVLCIPCEEFLKQIVPNEPIYL